VGKPAIEAPILRRRRQLPIPLQPRSQALSDCEVYNFKERNFMSPLQECIDNSNVHRMPEEMVGIGTHGGSEWISYRNFGLYIPKVFYR
jgi:hypothetical protein